MAWPLRVFGDPLLLRGAGGGRARPGQVVWTVDRDVPYVQQARRQAELRQLLGFGNNRNELGPGIQLCHVDRDRFKGDPINLNETPAEVGVDCVYVAHGQGSAGVRGRFGGRVKCMSITLWRRDEPLGLFFERRQRGPLYVSQTQKACARAGVPVCAIILAFDGKQVTKSGQLLRACEEWRERVRQLPAREFPTYVELVVELLDDVDEGGAAEEWEEEEEEEEFEEEEEEEPEDMYEGDDLATDEWPIDEKVKLQFDTLVGKPPAPQQLPVTRPAAQPRKPDKRYWPWKASEAPPTPPTLDPRGASCSASAAPTAQNGAAGAHRAAARARGLSPGRRRAGQPSSTSAVLDLRPGGMLPGAESLARLRRQLARGPHRVGRAPADAAFPFGDGGPPGRPVPPLRRARSASAHAPRGAERRDISPARPRAPAPNALPLRGPSPPLRRVSVSASPPPRLVDPPRRRPDREWRHDRGAYRGGAALAAAPPPLWKALPLPAPGRRKDAEGRWRPQTLPHSSRISGWGR